MISGNKYLFRTTDIEYFNDGDSRCYQKKRRVQKQCGSPTIDHSILIAEF